MAAMQASALSRRKLKHACAGWPSTYLSICECVRREHPYLHTYIHTHILSSLWFRAAFLLRKRKGESWLVTAGRLHERCRGVPSLSTCLLGVTAETATETETEVETEAETGTVL